MNKDQIKASLLAQLNQNAVVALVENLADASLQLQDKDAEIVKLRARVLELEGAMDKAPAEAKA